MSCKRMNPAVRTWGMRHMAVSLCVGVAALCVSAIPREYMMRSNAITAPYSVSDNAMSRRLRADNALGPSALQEQDDEFAPLAERMPMVAFGPRGLSAQASCNTTSQCGSGQCLPVNDGPTVTYQCVCNSGYISTDGNICNYEQKEKLTAFLLSFFVGVLGVDWWYLAYGVAFYNGMGALKLFTLGGCCVWALADWIRILCGTFPDGNGMALKSW